MESRQVVRNVLVLAYLFSSVCALQIELYSEKDRRGQSIKIDVSDNDCSELPPAWHNGVASVDTLGSCVQFYDEPNCKGSLTVIQPFHIIHQMDLSLINYAYRLRTASPCGPKVKNGKYVIQNAADASVMASLNKHGNFARVWAVNATKAATVPKTQQWEVVEKTDSEYYLKPRENSDNYPVSFDESSLKKGSIRRKTWKIMSVGRGRYIIKDPTNQRCLYKTDDFKVEEHSCRIWSTNQEWVFRTILGDTPSEKSIKAQVGSGYNFNIISKVGTSRPPTRPPPQYYPIHYNATKLAQIQKFSTASPYVVRKKIKRGPRPKTKYIEEPFLDLKPPGLRPAIPKNIANNNNYLLFKPPNGIAKDSYLPDFIPTDDIDLIPTKEMIKNSKQYKDYMEIVKQYLTEQYLKSIGRDPNQQQLLIQQQEEQKKKKKKPAKGDEDEEDGDDEEDEDQTSADEEGEVASDEESLADAPQKPKKPKNKDKEHYDSVGSTGSQQQDLGVPASSADVALADQPGFMSQVFNKFKSNFASLVPSVQIKLPKISNVLPSLPSLPVPKVSLSFTKEVSASASRNDHLKSKSNIPKSGTSSSGFTYSYAGPGKYSESSRYSYSSEEHPKYTFHTPRGPGKLFARSSTSTKKPLTVGSWGIFG